MKINPNEPVLPKQKGDMTPGLTKLEWAAVQIMAGFAADPDFESGTEGAAKLAVVWARALFAELENQG